MKDIHHIQAQILKNLLLRRSAKFSDLKPKDVPSDQFTFHLKRLVDEKILTKDSQGLYEFTAQGKEYANRFDIDSGPVKTERQAKLSVLVIPSREKDGAREFVMQTRLKQPFYGFKGFITGKIKWGESVIETAARELKEETGLIGTIQQKSIYHEFIHSSTGELLEDKYFFICTAENLTGTLLEDFEGGKNEWIPESEISKGNIFYDISDLLALSQDGAAQFSEQSYVVESY